MCIRDRRTPAQWKTQWEYLKTLMKALQATDPDGNGNPDTLAQTIKFSYKFVFENITVSNIASAIRLLNYMRKAKQGFDLYVSEDGVNFQTITVDGFGDPYNPVSYTHLDVYKRQVPRHRPWSVVANARRPWL